MSYRIKLPERLTVEKSSIFRNQLYELIQKEETDFIIDFSECKFIDSTGLGVLVSVYKKCMEKGGNLKLCSVVNPEVMKVFKLTRLDKVFDIQTNC